MEIENFQTNKPAHCVPESPLLVNVSGGREREVDGREEEVGDGEGDDEHRRGVRPQLRASGQCDDRQQIT